LIKEYNNLSSVSV